MLHIALYEPEIPPNTGNIIRLVANTGALLHLIKPLGFSLDEKRVRRAGLDYHQMAHTRLHENYTDFVTVMGERRIFGFTTKAQTRYDRVTFQDEDVLLFGPETRGLPSHLLATFPDARKLRLPMQSDSRSINLSNACAIALYEAWRQLDFHGCNQ
jgi:tRNA (cytidine(34)-2'-O)-methyltransferase